MSLEQVMKELQQLGSEEVRVLNTKNGATKNQFGVRLGEIRKVAKAIRLNHELALELWDTENSDAQLLAILIMKPKLLTGEDVDRLVRTTAYSQVADWLSSYIVKKHAHSDALREGWMNDAESTRAARAGWSLTAERVTTSPEGLDLTALLDQIEAEMSKAAPEVQWTMNNTLAAIGINNPKLRKRALEIGEKLGVYRDYPTSKGCTSPFAPIWIREMVRRAG